MRYPRTLCSIQVNNPGGASGAATVQTDGVTIQGDGSTGNKIAIKQVELTARLTGAGTVASPLDIAGWPVNWTNSVPQSGVTTAATNGTTAFGFSLGYTVTSGHVFFYQGTPDAVNNSDVGIYNAAGTLLANIGAQTTSGSNAFKSYAWTQVSVTFPPGLYLFAFTSASNTYSVGHNANMSSWVFSTSGGTTSGGALLSSITPIAVSPGTRMPCFSLY